MKTQDGTRNYRQDANAASSYLGFEVDGSESMRILSGGQLVINSTTLPVIGTEKLGVNGGDASNSVALAGRVGDRLGIPLALSNGSDTTNTYFVKFFSG